MQIKAVWALGFLVGAGWSAANITKIREGPFGFVIDKISCPLSAGIYDIELQIFPDLKHPRGADHGTGCHGGI
jgi:hypothetical protein